MRMVRAREMRSFGVRGQGLRTFVSLIGTLFLRTIERAERIYHAMLSRGFTGTMHVAKEHRFGGSDLLCLAVTGTALFICRTFDIVGIIGKQAERIF
jgi:cobalt/nickel transport system permease protein